MRTFRKARWFSLTCFLFFFLMKHLFNWSVCCYIMMNKCKTQLTTISFHRQSSEDCAGQITQLNISWICPKADYRGNFLENTVLTNPAITKGALLPPNTLNGSMFFHELYTTIKNQILKREVNLNMLHHHNQLSLEKHLFTLRDQGCRRYIGSNSVLVVLMSHS